MAVLAVHFTNLGEVLLELGGSEFELLFGSVGLSELGNVLKETRSQQWSTRWSRGRSERGVEVRA